MTVYKNRRSVNAYRNSQNKKILEFHATLKDAHSDLKDRTFDPSFLIELFVTPHTNEGLISILNGSHPCQKAGKGDALRAWTLLPRGGLKEIPVGYNPTIR